MSDARLVDRLRAMATFAEKWCAQCGECPDLFREAAAALAQRDVPRAEPVAWMYETERSCVGPFTERVVTFTLDKWDALPPKYKETPLYAAPQERSDAQRDDEA